MKKLNPLKVGSATAFAFLLLATSISAQSITQTITLQPGWNAVWLEVQPPNNSASSVFSNLPVASVWSRAERVSSVDFIQNPSEESFNERGWLAWLPAWRAESFMNNLFAVFANQAYLLRCTNTTPVVWVVTGRPSLRQPKWVPDAFNLRGAPIDPVAPPTFLNFFRYSSAHFNAASGQLQKIYRLNNASGQWQLVAANDTMQSGAAYWIYSQGASDYLSPLGAQVEIGDGLDFGLELSELSLRIRNFTTSPATALLRDVGNPTANPFSYYQVSPTLGGGWPALPNPLTISLAGGRDNRARLGVRRQDFSGQSYASVLEIRNGTGTRLLVPMSVEKFTGTASRLGGVSAAGATEPLAGLWVGAATVNAVSEVGLSSTNPTPTKSQLNLRLIIHVDGNGQARLLKDVIQMWRNGTYTNDGSGNLVVDKPGQYVLLTDDTLIPLFSGSALRDGESVGKRISTIGYDFPSDATNNYLGLIGSFAIGQKLTGTLTLPYDSPTNPFKHKYHPDHDNLNARFDGPAIESYTTSRQIECSFENSPPAGGPAEPDFGYNVMGGTYRETITGIHKKAIYVSGMFRLTRISQIAELNPSPTP